MNNRDFGVYTTPFKVLSDAGVRAVQSEIERAIASGLTTSTARTKCLLRGAQYYSSFLRDLSGSPELQSFVEKLAGKRLIPHRRESQVHVNVNEGTQPGDKWHTDSVAYALVILVKQPEEGGAYKFFRGHPSEFKGKAAEMSAYLHKNKGKNGVNAEGTEQHGLDVTALVEKHFGSRVEGVNFLTGPGSAIFQHGQKVMHMADRAVGARVSLVISYEDPAQILDMDVPYKAGDAGNVYQMRTILRAVDMVFNNVARYGAQFGLYNRDSIHKTDSFNSRDNYL